MMNGRQELLAEKVELYRVVSQRFDENISALENEIRELQSSANEETKSSAGDKYETGRAMAQLEIEKSAQQLQDKLKAREVVRHTKADVLYDAVQLGAVAETNSGNFFLLVNGGDVVVNEKKFVVISLSSPLGKLLLGRANGDALTLNNRTITISNVY
jgi:transcription elongation GreA/GreB family factor